LFFVNFRMKVKEVLGGQNPILSYEAHTDTANKQGSYTKKIFMI